MTVVRIRDISPRLTFQAQEGSTAQKVELIDRLTAAGVSAVEVSSFVRPDYVPGLADAADVFAQVERRPGVSLECCIGNERGLRRAIDAGADVAWFLLSTDEGFAQANTGASVAESIATLAVLAELAKGSGTTVGTYLIFAWGGPVGPALAPARLLAILDQLPSIGVTEWILADSGGYASPTQIHDTITAAAALTKPESLTVQVHDSRGMGVADIAELARLGVRNLDTSLTGAGGHPAVPGARVGGVCTEDAVQLLELMGYDTGIDLAGLIDSANWFDEILGGNEGGFVRHVGPVPLDGTTPRPRGERFSWSR